MSETPFYFDPDGQPITRDQWLALVAKGESRWLAEDVVNGIRVVTIWMGVDTCFPTDPPMICSTGVLRAKGGGKLLDEEFHPNQTEALARHFEIVKAIREGRYPKNS